MQVDPNSILKVDLGEDDDAGSPSVHQILGTPQKKPGVNGAGGRSDAPIPPANDKSIGSMMGQLIPNAAKNLFGEIAEISLEYQYDQLAKACNNFEKSRLLGAGAAGSVYRGTLSGGTEVAIKELVDQGGLEGFEDEVQMLSRFRHPNVVTLFGWGARGKMKYLIYEVLLGGDLQVKLKKCQARKDGEKPQPFTWEERLRVALDSAAGLSHMVNSSPMAFHRDIKSANILLCESGAAKIADFGLAGLVQNESSRQLSVKTVSGTPGYACATYIQTRVVTESSEVYSFGIVLLELLTNRPPALVGPEGDMIYPLLQAVQPAAPGAHDRILANLDPQARWPQHIVDDFADLALSCVDLKPERRPSYENIVRTLRRLSHGQGELNMMNTDQRQEQVTQDRRGHGGYQASSAPTAYNARHNGLKAY